MTQINQFPDIRERINKGEILYDGYFNLSTLENITPRISEMIMQLDETNRALRYECDVAGMALEDVTRYREAIAKVLKAMNHVREFGGTICAPLEKALNELQSVYTEE